MKLLVILLGILALAGARKDSSRRIEIINVSPDKGDIFVHASAFGKESSLLSLNNYCGRATASEPLVLYGEDFDEAGNHARYENCVPNDDSVILDLQRTIGEESRRLIALDPHESRIIKD